MRRRREILRFCSATQHKSFILTTAVVIWAFFKVSLVGSRLGRREIGSSKLGRRDEFNLHMNRLRWRQFGSIWLGRREFGSSRLRRVCRLQSGIDKLGGSRLRWSEHRVSRPVLRKRDCSTAPGSEKGSSVSPCRAEEALEL